MLEPTKTINQEVQRIQNEYLNLKSESLGILLKASIISASKEYMLEDEYKKEIARIQAEIKEINDKSAAMADEYEFLGQLLNLGIYAIGAEVEY